MKKVWVVESGDYEQRCISLIASSLSNALSSITKIYKPPYIVDWHIPVQDYQYNGKLIKIAEGHSHWDDDNTTYLTGDFKAVTGYSTEHTNIFEITSYEVENG